MTLVLGPTHISTDDLPAEVIRVTSAEEMFKATTSAFKDAEVAILAAAVSDYRPQMKSDKKIKKSNILLHTKVGSEDIIAITRTKLLCTKNYGNSLTQLSHAAE